MIYLASPYSHSDLNRRFRRFLAAREYVWSIMPAPIFSPIVYCHQFDRDFDAPMDHTPWKPMNDWYLDHCSEMHVLRLLGWEESAGVTYEIERAQARGLPTTYVDPLPHTKDW